MKVSNVTAPPSEPIIAGLCNQMLDLVGVYVYNMAALRDHIFPSGVVYYALTHTNICMQFTERGQQ